MTIVHVDVIGLSSGKTPVFNIMLNKSVRCADNISAHRNNSLSIQSSVPAFPRFKHVMAFSTYDDVISTFSSSNSGFLFSKFLVQSSSASS